MNIADKIIDKLDRSQRKHPFPAFTYAVIKKYSDDHAGYQAALLTYYAFLSLFPLLLVLTTVTSMIASTHPDIKDSIINSITNYFPVLGDQLSNNVHTLHKRGLALITGLLFTFYGARGVADAFRHGVNQIWQVPYERRDSFPKSALKSLTIIVLGGMGLLIASFSAGIAASAGHGIFFTGLSALVNLFVLFWVFIILLNISLPKHVTISELRLGAATAAFGLVILQTAGGYLLGKELRNLDALYSSFAITLGLLFWIYLQSQMLYYSIELANVRAERLWPRSLTGKNLTPADKIVYARQAEKEQVVPGEAIETTFEKS
jgi:YihY family inner membrane protein